MIIGYGRVSTSEQALDAGALKNQLERLKRAGAVKVFWDVDKRTNDKRKGMQQLMQYIDKECVAKLVFTRLDRVAASSILFYELLSLCRRRKVELVCLDEPLDLSIGGELGIDVRLAAAKYEVKMTSLRISKVNEERRGAKKANYFPPNGYKVVSDKYEQDHTLIVCLIEGKKEFTKIGLVQLEVEVFMSVRSIAATARALNEMFGVKRVSGNRTDTELINTWDTNKTLPSFKKGETRTRGGVMWTPEGLLTHIQNPILAGATPYDTRTEKGGRKPVNEWKVQWGTHDDQAIITQEQHFQIREIIQGNRHNKWAKHQPRTYPYSGLLRCAVCNSRMRIQAKQKCNETDNYKAYYQCAYYDKGLCKERDMAPDIEIDKMVTQELAKHSFQITEAISKPIEYVEAPEIKELKSQIVQLRAIGSNEVIEGAIAQLQKKIDELLVQSTDNDLTEGLKESFVVAFSQPGFYQSLSNQDKSDFLRCFVRCIYVEKRAVVKILYRF